MAKKEPKRHHLGSLGVHKQRKSLYVRFTFLFSIAMLAAAILQYQAVLALSAETLNILLFASALLLLLFSARSLLRRKG